jgi:hypothetical protein
MERGPLKSDTGLAAQETLRVLYRTARDFITLPLKQLATVHYSVLLEYTSTPYSLQLHFSHFPLFMPRSHKLIPSAHLFRLKISYVQVWLLSFGMILSHRLSYYIRRDGAQIMFPSLNLPWVEFQNSCVICVKALAQIRGECSYVPPKNEYSEILTNY